MIVLVSVVDGVGSCGVGAVPTVETVSICVQTSSLPIMIEFLCVGHVGPRALLHVPHTVVCYRFVFTVIHTRA